MRTSTADSPKVRRREVHAALVGEEELLLVEPVDAEHEHVVHPLPGLEVDRVRPPAPVETVHLPVHEVRGPPVLGHLLRRLRHRERELVEVGHGRHAAIRLCDDALVTDRHHIRIEYCVP